MITILGILIYGLIVWCLFSPRVRNQVRDVLVGAWDYLQLGGLSAYDAAVAFLYGLIVLVVVDIVVLIIAVAIGIPGILVAFFVTNALLWFVPMYVLWLLHLPVAAAGAQIRWLGTKLGSVPLLFFPFFPVRLIGRCVHAVGTIVVLSAALARWMTGLLVQVTLISLLLSGLALLDLEMGWHIVNPFTMTMAGLLWMTITSLQIFRQTHPGSDGIKILGRAAIGVLLAVGVVHYWPLWKSVGLSVLSFDFGDEEMMFRGLIVVALLAALVVGLRTRSSSSTTAR